MKTFMGTQSSLGPEGPIDPARLPPLDRLVAVDRDGNRVRDVMAAAHVLYAPALAFEHLDELLV
jgi:hypothetical protein